MPTRRVVAAVALTVALLGTAYAVGALSRWAAGTKNESLPRAMPLALGEVYRVVVTEGTREVQLARRPDGSWSTGTGAAPATKALMADIEERLFPLLAYRALRADHRLTQFGLTDSQVVFRVEGVKGDEHGVVLGAPTFTGGGVYARRSDDPTRVYLVPRRMMDDIRSLAAGQRIDADNEVPRRIRELSEGEPAREGPLSFWLQQAIDAGVALPEELR